MEELWKKIIINEKETCYSVSNLGRVRNDLKMTFLSGYTNNHGYRMVHLRNRIDKMCSIHRLVMKAFCPCEDMDDLQINHIDGNKENNCITNLEWATPLKNMRHSYLTGLQKKQMRPCYVYDLDGNYIESFLSAYECSKVYHLDQATIQRCLHEELRHYKQWQFKPYKKNKISSWEKKKQKEVFVYLENGEFFKHYNEVKDCAQDFSVGESSVYRYMNKTRKKAGFIFSDKPL